MKLSIIVPAYNEEKTIIDLLNKVLRVKFNCQIEIIVVNDCSKDSTLKKLKEYSKTNKITIIDNEQNLGKSRSVVKGILQSTGDYIVIQDADLEYDPNDLLDILSKIQENNLDFVYGDRFNTRNKIIYKSFYIGNKGITFISNVFTFPRFKKFIPDMEVCYKMVKGNILRELATKMRAKSNFGFEPEVTALLAKYKINGSHLKFQIVPIKYFPRTIEQGKKIRWKDGVKAFGEIVKYNLTNV